MGFQFNRFGSINQTSLIQNNIALAVSIDLPSVLLPVQLGWITQEISALCVTAAVQGANPGPAKDAGSLWGTLNH